jgi:hypothetical protein
MTDPMTMSGDVKSLRAFGFLVGGIFLLMGVWPAAVRREDPRLWALTAAILLLGPAVVYPRALGPVHRVWMKIGHALGWINTRIILGFLFYVIVTPLGLLMRLRGKDPMRRAFDPRAATYRLPRQVRPASHMKHQF